MNTKRFKSGKDLSNEFLRRIESIFSEARLQIVAIDTYDENTSLKDRAPISHKKLATPLRDFNVNLGTNVERSQYRSYLPAIKPSGQ